MIDLYGCQISPEGYFCLSTWDLRDTEIEPPKYAGVDLASIGRNKKTGKLYGSLTTCFAAPEWQNDYDLVWLHPTVQRKDL